MSRVLQELRFDRLRYHEFDVNVAEALTERTGVKAIPFPIHLLAYAVKT